MNSQERVTAVLSGRLADRVPNFDVIMAFGAHFIGEKLSHYYLDHRVLAESNLAVMQAFDLDIVQAISDPYREAVDFGVKVTFPEDGLPLRQEPLLASPEQLGRLRAPLPESGRRMSDRLAGVQALRQQVGNEAPVMGWVEGALAEANVLRGDAALMLDFYDRPDWVEELLEICVNVEIAFARAQLAAGATIIGLGDAIASTLSPKAYQRFGLPYEQRIFQAVHESGGLARLHICGNTNRLLPLMAESGADLIDIDWMVDIHQAVQTFAGKAGLCGNFDPVRVMYQGTPDLVSQAVLECLEAGGPCYFSGAGCEIPDGTPHENLRAQAAALREASGLGKGLTA